MVKKRIAIFAEKLYGGGVEKILQIVCGNFDYNHYDLTLYASRMEEMPLGTYPERLNINYFFDGGNGFIAKIKNKLKLCVYYHFSPSVYYQLFIREKYDVGIAFIEGYATRFLSGAPSGMRKIAWLHTDIENNHWTWVAFRNKEEERTCYRNFDKIVCVSKIVEESFQKVFGVTGTMIIHNPIDTEKIIAMSVAEMRYPKMKDIRIVTIGSLIPVKGYDRLLRVVKRLVEEQYEFELLIMGEGVQRAAYENFISENNLFNHVKLMGYMDNPYPILKSADIYVCSSYAEGFNTAITEALVLGVPVVTTEISGVREQLGSDSYYGIITENSEEGLADGIRTMFFAENRLKYTQRNMDRNSCYNLDNQMQLIYSIL